MTVSKYLIFFISIMLMSSCVKTDDNGNNQEDEAAERIIILNEGAFSGNNASLSAFNLETKEVKNDLFMKTNDFPMGDVGQSMTLVNDSLLWIIVNNSGKIEIVNTNTYEAIGTIENLTSPRFMVTFPDKMAYVSDIVAKSLDIIDMRTLSVVGQIPLTHTVESIVNYDDRTIIAAGWVENNQLYKIDVISQEIIDSLQVAYEPNSMAYDSKGNLWVLCGGGYYGASFREKPVLIKVDPEKLSILGTYPFASDDHYPSELVFNEVDNHLYFLVGTVGTDTNLGVYRIAEDGTEIPDRPLIPHFQNTSYYKLNITPDGSLWVTDAADFSKPGSVYKYDTDGKNEEFFTAGIVPSRILYYSNK